MNIPIWLAVAIGGAAGSVARYGTVVWAKAQWPAFPAGTLIVNVSGGLLIGLLAGLFAAKPGAPEWLRFGLISGVLGGYTTFSAFSLDTLDLWRSSGLAMAAGNVAANVVLSLAACLGGLLLARAMAA